MNNKLDKILWRKINDFTHMFNIFAQFYEYENLKFFIILIFIYNSIQFLIQE